MKKLIYLVVALMLIATVANAQPPIGYIGLFASEDRLFWCVAGATPFYPVEAWILCMPSYLGQICAEFMICNPPNVIPSTVTFNDAIISVILADLDVGISVCYVACQWNWHWIAHRLYYVTDFVPTYIEICAHPDVGTIQFANCDPGYPTEPCIKFTNLYLNYEQFEPECLGMATQNASWGAIKSMMGK